MVVSQTEEVCSLRLVATGAQYPALAGPQYGPAASVARTARPAQSGLGDLAP